MVIGCYNQLEIGKVYLGKIITDHLSVEHKQLFKVIELATQDDYFADIISMGVLITSEIMRYAEGGYFYRISID